MPGQVLGKTSTSKRAIRLVGILYILLVKPSTRALLGENQPKVLTVWTERSELRSKRIKGRYSPSRLVSKGLIARLKMRKKKKKTATITDWKKTRDSDWERTGRILTHDVQQTIRERELEEKGNESFMFKASSF